MKIRNMIITIVVIMLLVCTLTSCASTSSKADKQVITIKLESISPAGFKQTSKWALTPERTFWLKHQNGPDSTEFRIMEVQDSPLIKGFKRGEHIGEKVQLTIRWNEEDVDRGTPYCELLNVKFLD